MPLCTAGISVQKTPPSPRFQPFLLGRLASITSSLPQVEISHLRGVPTLSKCKCKSPYAGHECHYTPENKRLEPENTPLEKEKHLQTHQFLGSMFVLGGVFLNFLGLRSRSCTRKKLYGKNDKPRPQTSFDKMIALNKRFSWILSHQQEVNHMNEGYTPEV